LNPSFYKDVAGVDEVMATGTNPSFVPRLVPVRDIPAPDMMKNEKASVLTLWTNLLPASPHLLLYGLPDSHVVTLVRRHPRLSVVSSDACSV
jgi:hypothetical protein